MKIAIDAMGGDCGLTATIPATLAVLEAYPDITQVHLFGDEAAINNALDSAEGLVANPSLKQRLQIRHAARQINMTDKPATVLRERSETSMLLALRALAADEVDACVSSGNTGALIGLARHCCGTFEGVRTVAICAQLPNLDHPSYLLDVGANVDCSASQLHQFARMGCGLVNSLYPLDQSMGQKPKVRALSIGVESGKGNQVVTDAVALCADDASMDFAGLIEANQLLMDDCDVVVCDGFTGNIALKACEGTADYIRRYVQQALSDNSRQLSGVEQSSQRLLQAVQTARFNGAVLLGLRRTVIKSHGASDAAAFQAAIVKAITLEQGDFTQKMMKQLS
jgi:glycerol-3-phosphate acyltransferase PlsX